MHRRPGDGLGRLGRRRNHGGRATSARGCSRIIGGWPPPAARAARDERAPAAAARPAARPRRRPTRSPAPAPEPGGGARAGAARGATGKRRTVATRAATAPARRRHRGGRAAPNLDGEGGGARRPRRGGRAAPAARGVREVLAEAEKLLGQGEIGDACARGEEAKRHRAEIAARAQVPGQVLHARRTDARGQRQLQAVSRAGAHRARRALRQEHDQVTRARPAARAVRRVVRARRVPRARCSVDDAAFRGARLRRATPPRAIRAAAADAQRPADDLLPRQPARRHRLLHAVVRRTDVAPRRRAVRAGQRAARRLQSGRRRRRRDGPCGRSDLGCLRTDVTSDEGVCVTMQPCTTDSDCPNPVRSTCAATFLNQLYANNPEPPLRSPLLPPAGLRGGRLNCGAGPVVPAQAGRGRRRTHPTSASPTAIRRIAARPTTSASASCRGTGSPPICLPGLLGFLCESDIDCIVGKCISDKEPDETLRLEPVHACPAATTPNARSSTATRGSSSASPTATAPAAARRPTPTAARAASTTPTARATRAPAACSPASRRRRPIRGRAAACARRHRGVHAARRLRPRLPAVHGVARRDVEAGLLPRLLRPPLHRR